MNLCKFVGMRSIHPIILVCDTKFSNIKLDELTSKLGLSVKLLTPLGVKASIERNYASANLTIKKLIEEVKVPLSDSLIKVASWTHNTSIKKLNILLFNWLLERQ